MTSLRPVVILLLLGMPVGLAATQFDTGKIIEKVEVSGNKAASYALYLPTTYSVARKWPVLVSMDPRGRGTVAAQLHKAGAEKLGFIVIGVNGYFSDGPLEPAWEVIRVVWDDVMARFPIDTNRLYASGFSGGARMAWVLADYSEFPMSGIMGAGAGLPWKGLRASLDSSRLSFFGTVGETDFNYYEMADLNRHLDGTDISHRITEFKGGHSWPSEALATQALYWLEVDAMKRGIIEKRVEFLTEFSRAELTRSREDLEADNHIEAEARLASLVWEREDSDEVKEARETLERIRSLPDLESQRKQRLDERRNYQGTLARVEAVVHPVRTGQIPQPRAERMARDLGLAKLQAQAADPASPQQHVAKRLLGAIFTDMSFYVPRDLMRSRKYPAAQACLQLALMIRDDQPVLWYLLARAFVLEDRQKEALGALEKAIEKGWSNWSSLESDAEFSKLRSTERWRKFRAKYPDQDR